MLRIFAKIRVYMNESLLVKKVLQPDIELVIGKHPEHIDIFDSYNARPPEMNELYDLYLTFNPDVAEKVSNFLIKVEQKYTLPDRLYIEKALKFATVCYQFNHHAEKRFRKERDPKTNKPIPTLFHSLEMAERLVDEGSGFKWTAIAAILLHDIPEDVKLEFIEDNQEKIIEGDKWFDILSSEFKNNGEAEILIDLIKGVTEKQLPQTFSNDGRRIRDRLIETQLFKIIQNFVALSKTAGKKREIYGTERELIYEVVYNLEHIFEYAFKSKEHLQILLLKITDIWHNFQSPKWIKEAKILRGRIAASLAEWIGWYSMRSDIILQLAEVTDTTRPYAPLLNSEKYIFKPAHWDTDTSEEIKIVRKFLNNKLINNWGFSGYALINGWPVTHTDTRISNWQETTLSPPEFIVRVNRDEFASNLDKIGKYAHSRISTRLTKSGEMSVNLEKLSNNSNRLVNKFGRIRRDFMISPGNKPSFYLRIEDDSPYLINIFQNGNTYSTADVPEIKGIFNDRLKSTSQWNTHLSSLIGFLYEPNIAISRGKLVMAVIYDGSLYFIDGLINFYKLAEILGIENIHKRIITDLGNQELKIVLTKPLYENRTFPRQSHQFYYRTIIIN